MSDVAHGIRASLGPSGLRVDGPRSGAPTVVLNVHGVDGTLMGAVYGPVTHAEAEALVHTLSMGDDPGGPDAPWIAVARSGPHGLAASASTMLPSGVFWSSSDGTVVVASDPRSAASEGARIDPAYVRSWAAGLTDPEASPYAGVSRVRAGETARWETPDAQPRLRQWCGPDTWPTPGLAGPEAMRRYRDAFDAVVDDLARRAGRVVTTCSGGLDSTFVAAALAARDRVADPVLALTYAPVPGAVMALGPGLDADESGLVRLLEAEYPGRIAVETVVNTGLARPLDAAAAAGRLAGVPTFNPANQVWLTAMRDRAAEAGARLLFVGTNGNAAFSYDHGYAVRDGLRHGQWRDVAAMARSAGGGLSMSLLRSRVLRPLRHPQMTRPDYLTWLARRATGLPAASNPAALGGVLLADPFSSRAVLECAAAVTPAEWRMGGTGRAFARRAGEGRVPDAIRLRTRRGQQGRDAWHAVRFDRDDYLARIDALPGVPGLEDVDAAALRDRVDAWAWGSAEPPPWSEQVEADRLLSLAQFADVGG